MFPDEVNIDSDGVLVTMVWLEMNAVEFKGLILDVISEVKGFSDELKDSLSLIVSVTTGSVSFVLRVVGGTVSSE